MQERVVSFYNFAGRISVTKPCLEAMERGILHVDAVNSLGNTLGIVLGTETDYPFEFQPKYWLRYWALKPSVQTFWTILISKNNWNRPTILSRAALIPALWEDLSFIYNLVTAYDVHWLRKEVERRMVASLRFAWIAAVVGRQV